MIIAPVQGPLELKPIRKELDDISADDKIREFERKNGDKIRKEEKSSENPKSAVKEKGIGRNIDVTV